MAFANGSAFGQGLGNSNEKLFYLPEAHNDFIFSVIGEELGFLGVFFIICLFIAFIYFGFKLVLQVRDRVGIILGSAVVFVLGFQALLNMGVVLGLLPTKGLNLPFISYGGSSLICNFFGIGLLLSVVKGYRDQLRGDLQFHGKNERQSYSETEEVEEVEEKVYV
jgi:cell division protein FtsW